MLKSAVGLWEFVLVCKPFLEVGNILRYAVRSKLVCRFKDGLVASGYFSSFVMRFGGIAVSFAYSCLQGMIVKKDDVWPS